MQYRLRTLLTFSVRDILWIMLVAAMAISWTMERAAVTKVAADQSAERAAERKALKEQLAMAKATVQAKVDAAFEELGFVTQMKCMPGAPSNWRATSFTKYRVGELLTNRSTISVEYDGTMSLEAFPQ
jgi:hypothetical protein